MMPMGIAAEDAAQTPSPLGPLPMPPMGAAPAPAGPDPMAAAAATAAPPYQTRQQADGSVIAFIPDANGGETIIGVAPAFKVPKAFSAQPQPAL